MATRRPDRALTIEVSEATVVRYKLIEVGADKLLIPLECRLTFSDAKANQKADIQATIVESSLKINPPMDGGLFTLTPTKGTEVVDMDTVASAAQRQPAPQGAARNAPARRRRTWVLASSSAAWVVLVCGFHRPPPQTLQARTAARC